jgi:hypothetical protein
MAPMKFFRKGPPITVQPRQKFYLTAFYDKIFATNFRVNPIIKQIHFSNCSYHIKDFNQIYCVGKL